MKRNTGLSLLAVLGLLATLLVFTAVPGWSVWDMNIDVGMKVVAFYVAYVAWAILTAVLLVNVVVTLSVTHEQAKA
jgi:hypothetical protein